MEDDAYFERREQDEILLANLLGLLVGPHLNTVDTVSVRNDILKTVFAGETDESLYQPLLAGILEGLEDDTDFDVENLLGLKNPLISV